MPTVKIVPFPGVPGPQGPAGPTGPQGPQGIQGEPGESASFPNPVSWTPVISASGFLQTSNPATADYLRYGKMVVVNMYVPFSNVINFGNGQYSVTLPFQAAKHTDVFVGSIHNTGTVTEHYSLKGHMEPNSSQMTLWHISGASKDEPFTYNSPIVLNTTDLFHASFMYEISE